MEKQRIQSSFSVADVYTTYYLPVYRYIYYKINHREDAEDLAQDVFLRLIDSGRMIYMDTIKAFVFKIAQNLVTDYLRHYYSTQEVIARICECAVSVTNDTESRVIADDLADCEKARLNKLPPQRRTIYAMSRFEGKSVSDISLALNLSPRTVENHLFISRKEVRSYMRQCI